MGPDLPGMCCSGVVPLWRISVSGRCVGMVEGGGRPRVRRHIQGHRAHAHQLVSGRAEGLRRGWRQGWRYIRAMSAGIIVRGGRIWVGPNT